MSEQDERVRARISRLDWILGDMIKRVQEETCPSELGDLYGYFSEIERLCTGLGLETFPIKYYCQKYDDDKAWVPIPLTVLPGGVRGHSPESHSWWIDDPTGSTGTVIGVSRPIYFEVDGKQKYWHPLAHMDHADSRQSLIQCFERWQRYLTGVPAKIAVDHLLKSGFSGRGADGMKTKQAWNRIESGTHVNVSVGTLEGIATALGVKAKDLLK